MALRTRGSVVFVWWLALAASGAQSQPDLADLREVAMQLRSAIIKGDHAAVLRHIARSGLMCTDTPRPYAQLRKDLANRKSHLYMSLFDSQQFAQRCGAQYPARYPAISDREFFTAAADAPIEIRRLASDRAQVTYTSPVPSHYPREYVFQREHGAWKLVEGLIVGSCTCG